ncbi:hypothetical protein [Rhizobium leguminosarum]|uniref:hypothetical protein n=1 Tax=Rhizobium leguminosarum TaxID=384 RepID=UPI00103AF0C1|nr:hypothetical protein [Rhizobium leguminosarum]TBY16178.1 hypothetical protein E0H30_30470 [Rhizobium leguminosarum bv. viciae]TBY25485.1 hypothetical protein E0H37_22165 [Rhizobium leguminosarum bv. viciae]TBY95375.1 hypothetical protein E0H49_29535 [Rhizobium leguminosarum bv. viciae]
MTRTDIRTYDPTTPEAAQALLGYLNATTKTLKGKEVVGETVHPIPHPEDLLQGLPQGSLSAARYDHECGLIALTIKDRNERFIEPEAFLVLRVLSLFNGGAYIDTSQRGADGYHYLEMFSRRGMGITLQRLLADAQKGELVKMREDHHLVTATNLAIVPGSQRNTRGRREAFEAALADYDERATSWGLARLLSKTDYLAMLRGAFRLYDIKHGHNFLRVIGE